MSVWQVDYHIHTNFSDGSLSPEQVVRQAKDQGMKAIAITDHDGIGGISQALQTGKDRGIKVVAGIEIASVTESGTGLHILGYGFDPEHPVFRDRLEWMNEERDKRNVKLIKVLNELGFDITGEELRYQQPNNYIGKPVIARELQHKGYVKEWRDAFAPGQPLGLDEVRAVKKEKVDAIETIRTINGAGGIAVLAHPIQIKSRRAPDDAPFYEEVDKLTARLKDAGLYGLECYHPDHNREQTVKFLDIAEHHGLKVSRGTDFHGDDYSSPRITADYIPEGNANGYGTIDKDFIEL